MPEQATLTLNDSGVASGLIIVITGPTLVEVNVAAIPNRFARAFDANALRFAVLILSRRVFLRAADTEKSGMLWGKQLFQCLRIKQYKH